MYKVLLLYFNIIFNLYLLVLIYFKAKNVERKFLFCSLAGNSYRPNQIVYIERNRKQIDRERYKERERVRKSYVREGSKVGEGGVAHNKNLWNCNW